MTVRTLEEEPPQDGAAARLVPGRPGPARPVAPGRPGLCPHRHALPGPHRAAGAAGLGRRRGHAGRLCAAHPQQAADRPVPDRRARTARPRRGTAPSGTGGAGAGGAAGPGADPRRQQDPRHRHPRRAGCVRRLSTRALRAERDRLAQLRADCPPDRSRELRLATQRAAEAEQARQQARTDQQAAAEQVGGPAGGLAAPAGPPARPGSGWCWPSTRSRRPPGRPTRRPSGWGCCGRAQQRHLGWMEAHDADLRVQERAVAREDAWRRRVDQRALALDPPGWLLAELGPVPATPRSGRCGAWPPRNWTATGAPTAWTTPGRRSMWGAGWPGTGGRRSRPRPPPLRGPAGCAGRRSAAAAASDPSRRPQGARR